MPVEICEACGQEIGDGEVFRAELSVGDLICPTNMTFHRACYDQAAEIWEPNPDSYCNVDPLFPETGQWTGAQQGSGSGS